MTEERYISLLSHVSSIVRLRDVASAKLVSIRQEKDKWTSMKNNPEYQNQENVRKGRIDDILMDLRSEELQTMLDVEAYNDMLGLAEEKLSEYNSTDKDTTVYPKKTMKVE